VEAFDTCYPLYTAKDGFKEGVEMLESLGVHTVPYTNGRLFDPSTPESAAVWQAEGAERFACKSMDGRPYTESYESGRNWSFVTMDPSTEYWQGKVAGAVGKIVRL
jgi:hypothetical protein